MSQTVKETDSEQELLNAFKVFDKDGSGTISTEELKNVLRSLGENLTDADLDEMVKLADKNGDGQIDCEFILLAQPMTIANADVPYQTRSLLISCNE